MPVEGGRVNPSRNAELGIRNSEFSLSRLCLRGLSFLDEFRDPSSEIRDPSCSNQGEQLKIRNPKIISAVAWLVSIVLRGWMSTMSFGYRPLTDYYCNDRPELLGDARYIYGFWHEHLLPPAYVCARPDTSVLIGTHADGELIAQVVQRLGMGVIRGSSTRGGANGLLAMIRESTRHLAITPDGPRGPRHKCRIGIIYLASVTGLPIVPFGSGYRRYWRARSWDKFVVPLPFGRIRGVSAHPIYVPKDLDNEQLEHYRLEVERMLTLVSDIAQNWADTGEFDPMGYVPPEGWLPSGKRRLFDSARHRPYSPSY